MSRPYDIVLIVILLSLPLVAITGGIIAGIVRTMMRHRALELAQKERIAAIERGIDPERLPQLQVPEGLLGGSRLTLEQRALKRSQALTIWGIVIVFFGASMFGLGAITRDAEAFGPGMIFGAVGLGLLVASRVGRPSAEEVRRSVERGAGVPAKP